MSEDGITLRGTKFTVSASEKISTGQYENYSPSLTLEGEIPNEELTEENRAAFREEALQLHGDLQQVLDRATANRTAEPEWEDWSFEEDEEVSADA